MECQNRELHGNHDRLQSNQGLRLQFGNEAAGAEMKYLLGIIVIGALAVGVTCPAYSAESSIVRCGGVSVSKTGMLLLETQKAKYMLVPEEKYPAQLRGISLLDANSRVYVARFFEPAGIGVESFFDVCFQVKGLDVMAEVVENAASLERIAGKTYVRSCSYVFDLEGQVLLKTTAAETEPQRVSLVKRLKPLPH